MSFHYFLNNFNKKKQLSSHFIYFFVIKCCYACQIHIDDFVFLGFPGHSNRNKKAAYFGVDARGQFYDHSPSNIDFCCTLCNFLKRKALSVKAMLHLDSQLEKNLAGFWKGIHNVSYNDDGVPNKVDLSDLVTGALGIAFPSINCFYRQLYT